MVQNCIQQHGSKTAILNTTSQKKNIFLTTDNWHPKKNNKLLT
jgi:hypothetical protein